MMLWLIWIALMILIPVAAGVHVWWQLNRLSQDNVVPQQPANE